MRSKIRNIINIVRFFLHIDKVKRGTIITQASQIKAIILPIPEEKFITQRFGMDECPGQSCFLGHIHRTLSPNGSKDYMGDWDGYGARKLTERFIRREYGIAADGADVNNKPTINGYAEPKIKDRVLHMVEDMIKAGY